VFKGALTMLGAVGDTADGFGVLAHDGLFAGREVDSATKKSMAMSHDALVKHATPHLLTWWSIPAVKASSGLAPKQTSRTGARCSKVPTKFASSALSATSYK